MRQLLKDGLIYTAILSVIFLSSCEKENGDNPELNPNDLIEYGGLKAKLPDDYDESVLQMSLEDLQNQYYSTRPSNNLKSSSSDDIEITLEEMDYLVSELLKNYPNTDSLTQNDIALIKKDFVGIEEEEIYENIDVIDSFYNAIVRFEYVNKLATYNPSLLKSSNDYLGYDVS